MKKVRRTGHGYSNKSLTLTNSILTEGQSGIVTVIIRAFDRLGRVTWRHDKVGSNSLYHWYEVDVAGRTHKVFSNTTNSKPGTADITTTYTPAGGVANETFAGNPAQPYKYDIRGRLVRMGDVNSATHPFSAELSYAGNGRITLAEMRNNASPATYDCYRYSYGYDASNQLTSADYSFWVPGSGWQTSANYDIPAITYNKSGNIITLKRRNQSGSMSDDATYYLQSGKNRIQYILDNGSGGGIDNVWYDYDASGNLNFIENFDSGQLHELTYDPSNRLIRVQELGYSDVTDYRISASGWRYWSKAGTANAIYSPRDGSSPLGEFSVGSFPFTWTLRRPDGSVYGRKGYSSNNEFFWTDHLGSVRVRTSNSGSMLEAHDYYPFGLDMPGRSSAGLPMRQGFTGYWRDREGGLDLYYSGARMYSPGTGRFFGVDPLAEEFATWSPYVYSMNSPMMYVDPDGRAPCESGTVLEEGARFCFQSNEEIIVTPQRNFVNLWYAILNSPVGDATISSEYGAQRTCANCSPDHKGTDYAVSVNTPVSVTANGTVVRSYYSRTFGNTVIVSHGPSRTGQGNVYTLYAHGSRLGAPQGGKVLYGDVILNSGNTGTNTTNPHLHYEVIISNHPPTSALFFTGGIRLSPSQLKNLIW